MTTVKASFGGLFRTILWELNFWRTKIFQDLILRTNLRFLDVNPTQHITAKTRPTISTKKVLIYLRNLSNKLIIIIIIIIIIEHLEFGNSFTVTVKLVYKIYPGDEYKYYVSFGSSIFWTSGFDWSAWLNNDFWNCQM